MTEKKSTAKTSPLTGKPLRQAGQSVQEQLDKLIDDKLMGYVLLILFTTVLALFEWYRWYMDILPNPITLTLLALIILVIFLPKIFKTYKQVKFLKLGRDGEKVVGEYLEHLRLDGCIVFHDIVGDKFNLDHVVLSPRGIYVIETKTWSKPDRKGTRVHFDGTHLFVDGLGNKDDVLIQVSAESSWLREMLKESTGKEFEIKPVIVFPGWYVESKSHNKYWIINPKGLPKFIQSQNEVLSKEDVKLAAFHLSRFIRAC